MEAVFKFRFLKRGYVIKKTCTEKRERLGKKDGKDREKIRGSRTCHRAAVEGVLEAWVKPGGL